MEATCTSCEGVAMFAVELPSGPGKRWSMWCSQLCLLEWEIGRMVVVPAAAGMR